MPTEPNDVERVALQVCAQFDPDNVDWYLAEGPPPVGDGKYDLAVAAIAAWNARAAIAAMPGWRDEDDWRLPYRTRDSGGSPESASAVGWEWINAVAEAEPDKGDLLIDGSGAHSGGASVAALYRGTKLLAATTVFRDQMNFAVLIRWRATLPTPPEPTT